MPTLHWIGKDAVVGHHHAAPFHLLKDAPDLACGGPGSGNLLVEGDNLLALKALLPRYAGRVKCIYIDPPYNTGNEGWVYNDAVNAPTIKDWLGKTVGKEAEDLCRHDKWLCMMYPRLALLREFLREDGVIFVSLDDNEISGLRLIMDEIFGTRSFIGTVIWEKADSPRMDAQYFSVRHDYIAVYSKNSAACSLNKLSITEDAVPAHYDKVSSDGRKYYLKPLRAMGGQGETRAARPTLYYGIKSPDGVEVFPQKQDGTDGAWRWSKSRVDANPDLIEWVKGRKGFTPYYRIYADGVMERPPETIWPHGDVGSNRTSKAELNGLFPEKQSFDTPKPVRLLERVLQIASNPGDLILDSFAGSGTTAHAVLKLNAENPDKPARQFITVEMERKIARDITAERIRRVATGYTNAKGEAVAGLGGGFRYCTLGEELFDAEGGIRREVSFEDLARFVWFTATGEPFPHGVPVPYAPLLGVHADGTAIYLLYNGVLDDLSPGGGNILTRDLLAKLPAHAGQKLVYAAGCRLSPEALTRAGILFRKTPTALTPTTRA